MKQYDNAFDLIADPAHAKLLLARSTLMDTIADTIKQAGLSQVQAAKIMKVSQPRVSTLLGGRLSKFGLTSLFLMNAYLTEYVES